MQKTLLSLDPTVKFGVIHGRQAKKARDKVMDEFRGTELSVLLSTTIVEVGVDIPGANVMLVEGAENMGLAQLHQLRGRVGRRGGEALLILVSHAEELSQNAKARFQALQSGKDGYELAELDLTLRGPGEDMGLKQSGWPSFSFLRLPKDLVNIDKAQKLALSLLSHEDEWSQELKKGLDAIEESLARDALGI
jgi:ATP-dependent DNA helicase RecG